MKTKFVAAFFAIGALLLITGCNRTGTTGHDRDIDYYTCTMHPSVKSHDPKAKCPICGMALVPVKKRATATATNSADYYTCTMHPSVKSKDPMAKCPICSMDLTPVKQSVPTGHVHTASAPQTSDTNATPTPTEFTVATERQQQIGVTYATAEKKPLQRTIRTVGVVAYDKQRHWDFVSRVEGYVQKLHVSSRGDIVESNQPLITIYSPDLLTGQREFVDLLRIRDDAKKSNTDTGVESAERMLESARRRLFLWNITTNQIAELEGSRQPKDTLTLFSPFKGVVQSIGVDQGRRVMAGEHLVDLADLSLVWVWADFYQDELPLLKKGLPVSITGSSSESGSFEGKIALIDPFINDSTRTARVRIDVPNPDFKLRPDLFVNVVLQLDSGEGTTVPVSAVLPTGEHNIVFVDKGEGRLEPRFVELGGKYGSNYAVKTGLNAGERVVNSANFLIDAESKVQGALKSF